MIMNRRAAKSLYWAGAVALACLGLAFLPAPVRAQQPTPDKLLFGSEVPSQGQPAKKTPSLDEQIEALRGVLQQLEEQKRKEQKSSALQNDLVMRLAFWGAFSNEEDRQQAIEALNRILEMLQKHGNGSNVVPVSPR